jgi:nicotinate phosphoribosyltransferase
MRKRREADIERLDQGIRRLVNPHIYHVSLTERLWNLKQEMVESMKEKLPAAVQDRPSEKKPDQ